MNKNCFKPNENFVYYLYWICERQQIFWDRLKFNTSYTSDEVLKNFKFTNVYRVLDRSSQFLLKNVIYNGKQYDNKTMLWRILLYKHFNLPSTWVYIEKEFGDINININFKELIEAVGYYKNNVGVVYSPAYMLTAPFMMHPHTMKKYNIQNDTPKHESYLNIFKKEIIETDFLDEILESKTFHEAFTKSTNVMALGGFLAYQYVQDWCYSDALNLDVNSFCFAGPGTKKGIARVFDVQGNVKAYDIVKWVHDNLEQLMKDCDIESLGCEFKPLPNLMPQIPDLSNCFCEIDKYLRMNGIETEGKKFKGTKMKCNFIQNTQKINYIFPPKWGVGDIHN